jgi:hypothetical protein
VRHNAQLSFVGQDPAFGDTPADAPLRETWLLLHFYDDEAEEIRCELSRPAEMTGKQVTGWSRRILLQSVSFSTELDLGIDDDDDDDVDFDVSRRAE